MNVFGALKTIAREKSGKKLAAFSAAVFLLLTAIVFFAVLRLCENIQLRLMDEYLWEIPEIVTSLKNELLMRRSVYEEEVLTRAGVGLLLYGEEDALGEAKKLEWVRGIVSADSVSLLDGERNVLATTGPVCPEDVFLACAQAVAPRTPRLEPYPVLSEDGGETEARDGKGFVLLSLPGFSRQSLLFEFSCDEVMDLYNELEDWGGVLARMFSPEDAVAFAKTGSRLTGYPMDGFTEDEAARLFDELEKIFKDRKSAQSGGDETSSKFTTLLGERFLDILRHYPEENTDVLLTVPLIKVIGNGIFIAAAISLVIGCGIVLFQLYAVRKLLWKMAPNGAGRPSFRQVCKATWPGILTVLAVTVIFSNMLLLLEGRTTTAVTTVTRRESVQHEIDWRQDQERTIRDAFLEFYTTRAQMLAAFLAKRPEYQTREGLEALSSLAGTDFLMRFDSAGQELFSSNSYTGFAVGKNLSEDYQAVLMGYPYAVSGPAADPYTGRMQFGTAILMTDAEGQADGFLLAVYSTGGLEAELARMSYETTVNNIAVREGQIACAISDEDGRFIAHTEPGMIGRKAEDFLGVYKPGSSFEGYTSYKGESVCVSATSADGRTLLFMVPDRPDSYAQATYALLTLAALLLLGLLYCPRAGLYIARAMEEEGELQPGDGASIPIVVLAGGYSTFLMLFALAAMVASANGWWTTFDYVFDGEWSRGVHLYSLWAALFILAGTLFCEFLLRAVLRYFESHLSLRAKTVTRLANSLITYACVVFLIFCILGIFGVNTTALLASAGVISIAVGMGAQSMAADLLAGFFMMLEGSIHVGDHVTVSGVTGHVTDMGIRTTEITDGEGNVVILNNSKVSPVRNMSRKQARQPEDGAKTELEKKDGRERRQQQ